MIRTNTGCYEEKSFLSWGTYFSKVNDQDENCNDKDIQEIDTTLFNVSSNFVKLPNKLCSAVLDLFKHFCIEDKFEVSVLLLTNGETWKAVVPSQMVTSASVYSSTQYNCDLLTGEEYTQFPIPGWKHAGSWHSHNFMSAFFSSTDNASDKYVQGLHLVTGSLMYPEGETIASITVRSTRFSVNTFDVIELKNYQVSQTFHPNALNYINTFGPNAFLDIAY